MSRTVESARELDVNWCNSEGLLEFGQSGTITWRRARDGTVTNAIGYTAVGSGRRVSAFRLEYTITPMWGDDRDVSYQVSVEWTPCHFDFRYEQHGTRNSVERVFREVKRRTSSFSNCFSNANAETANEWLRSFAFAWNQLI